MSNIPYGRRFPAACCRVFNKRLSEDPIRDFGRMVRKAFRSPVPSFKGTAVRFLDGNVRNMFARLQKLQGRYRGRRCFIMGTGPSINRMDLGLLAEDYVWGLNKCYLLFPRIKWRPSFCVAVDTRVVPDIARELRRLIHNMPETTFFFPVQFREQLILRSGANVYWYREVRLDETNLPDGMFTRDASKWVASVRTVTIAALQLAVYLGFNPIYLIGCDTSYHLHGSVRTEGDNGEKLISIEDDDPNHFDPRYFGKGSKWHEPHVDRMIFHYEQAKKVCDALGVRVYNATIDGNLDVFERIDYTQLF